VLEDLVVKPRLTKKLRAAFLSKFCTPKGLLKRCGGDAAKPDDLATVIFSSGSTGDPKGVMLTHRNVIANVKQAGAVHSFVEDDCMLGVLPFFHSFGFMRPSRVPRYMGSESLPISIRWRPRTSGR
jgi:acyl-[acyl-carrier-protein]-phospholipid O-acyltransferase/long-chain-fatty-acid--[acyl-carrier-protein] ligase